MKESWLQVENTLTSPHKPPAFKRKGVMREKTVLKSSSEESSNQESETMQREKHPRISRHVTALTNHFMSRQTFNNRLLSSFCDILIVISQDRTILWFSEGSEMALGVANEEIAERQIHDLVDGGCRPLIESGISKFLDQGSQIRQIE